MAAAAEYVCGMKGIGASYFFFDSFHTFDASSYPLITQMIRCAAGVCFTLTTGEGDFFEITHATLKKLTQAAADAAKPVRTTSLTGKKGAAQALCFLEENLPRYANRRCENPDGAVCLREYGSIEEEVAGVAADVCAYVRESGARYSDVGVAVSDLTAYGPAVEAVFKRYGIPAYIDSRKSVAYFAPVRALLLMLKMAQKPFSTEDMIAFAKTGFAPVGYGECEDIENYCLQYAVRGRRWQTDFTFDPERDYDLDYINGIRARLVACADAFAEEYTAQKTAGGQCRAAYGFVESYLSDKIAQSAQEDADAAANTYVQVYNKMLDIIECAYGLFEDAPAGRIDLASVLQYAFMCADIGTIPATVDTVLVGDIMRSRAPQVDAMFVLGVSEGAVPAVPRPGNIFTDSDKSQLKKSGVHLQNDTGYIIRKENFIFYTLLSRPAKYLGVSAVRSGDGARAFLFERLVTMFGLSGAPDDALHGIVNDETAYDFISARYGERNGGGLAAAVYDYFEDGCAQAHYAQTLKAAAAFTNEAVLHSAKDYDRLLGKDARLSVSKLEKYAQCPFGFYTGYILKPVQRKRYQIRRLDIGIVVHAVMEAFSQSCFRQALPRRTCGR
jgi:ATP-dependent helicase/nuclease subunit B